MFNCSTPFRRRLVSPEGQGSQTESKKTKTSPASRNRSKPWFCREFWTGDSKDGLFSNGDGYHYFEMSPEGTILQAYEYYETDDGEEKATSISEFIGINWYEHFGFEDDELLEEIPEHEFEYVKGLLPPPSLLKTP